jgi:hypothetical protein
MAADLNGYLLNCFIGGETFTAQPDGRRIRNKIELSFGGRDIAIIQKPKIVRENARNYRGKAVETTSIVVRNVRVNEREKVLCLLQGLSHLLSFASCSEVALYRWEHQDSPPLSEGRSVVARTGFVRPVFDLYDGGAIRTYLERVWQHYFKLEQSRQLREAIHLFVLSKIRGLPLELELATMFILLENLKSTHAREQGYRFDQGYYRKPSGKAWGFKALLSEMFVKVGMPQSDLSAIVHLRNEIVHSGISQTSYEHQQNIYDKSQDLVREYLLRLLGYTGDFRLYSGRGMTVKQIRV